MPQNCKKPHFCPGTRLVWSEQHFVPSLIFSPKKKSPPDLDHDSKFRVYMSSKLKKNRKVFLKFDHLGFQPKGWWFYFSESEKMIEILDLQNQAAKARNHGSRHEVEGHVPCKFDFLKLKWKIYSNQWLLTILNKTTKHQRCSKHLQIAPWWTDRQDLLEGSPSKPGKNRDWQSMNPLARLRGLLKLAFSKTWKCSSFTL